MMFYQFTQSLSGGFFIGERNVIVEAETPEEANRIAEQNGIYFDGIETGEDCECCGERWSRTSEGCSREFPHLWGTPIEQCSESYRMIKKLDKEQI
jgi:hypothetical protein